jgi:hypothetical protein
MNSIAGSANSLNFVCIIEHLDRFNCPATMLARERESMISPANGRSEAERGDFLDILEDDDNKVNVKIDILSEDKTLGTAYYNTPPPFSWLILFP